MTEHDREEFPAMTAKQELQATEQKKGPGRPVKYTDEFKKNEWTSTSAAAGHRQRSRTTSGYRGRHWASGCRPRGRTNPAARPRARSGSSAARWSACRRRMHS